MKDLVFRIPFPDVAMLPAFFTEVALFLPWIVFVFFVELFSQFELDK